MRLPTTYGVTVCVTAERIAVHYSESLLFRGPLALTLLSLSLILLTIILTLILTFKIMHLRNSGSLE